MLRCRLSFIGDNECKESAYKSSESSSPSPVILLLLTYWYMSELDILSRFNLLECFPSLDHIESNLKKKDTPPLALLSRGRIHTGGVSIVSDFFEHVIRTKMAHIYQQLRDYSAAASLSDSQITTRSIHKPTISFKINPK